MKMLQMLPKISFFLLEKEEQLFRRILALDFIEV